MKHPLEGIVSFLSLVLTKLYFSEHGGGGGGWGGEGVVEIDGQWICMTGEALSIWVIHRRMKSGPGRENSP